MGKKGKLYLIILVNLLAWGYVGNKVYCALQGDDDIDLAHEKTAIKKIEVTKKEDSVLLVLNYPDPFLKDGNFSKENKSNHSSANNHSTPNSNIIKPITQIKSKQEVVPPALDIKYIALVKNNDKGTQTAMISINNKSFFVKLNDVIEGFAINEISRDFIKIKKGKEVIVINK